MLFGAIVVVVLIFDSVMAVRLGGCDGLAELKDGILLRRV